MGTWYMYGTSNSSGFDDILKKIDENMKNVEANEDGSLDFEIIIKGKTEKRIGFTSTNGSEIEEITKLNSN